MPNNSLCHQSFRTLKNKMLNGARNACQFLPGGLQREITMTLTFRRAGKHLVYCVCSSTMRKWKRDFMCDVKQEHIQSWTESQIEIQIEIQTESQIEIQT